MIKDFLSYLLSLETQGIKLGLDRTYNILSACGHPQNNLKIVQVVGTNGKGSTSAMIANIFKQANYKVGLYTSPHLYRINERIRVNGQSISDNSIIEFINSEENISNIVIFTQSKIQKSEPDLLQKIQNKINADIVILDEGESSKELNKAMSSIENLISIGSDRNTLLISYGGGAVSDHVGFIASIFKRGIKFINIPTTLLAQVDSSIGGKTAVNSHQGKNLIGTIYQPDFVLIDMSVLRSLPKREMICGYGEILKHSLISDRKFFFWLNKNGKKIINRKDNNILINAITKSCKIKSSVVGKDESEKNLRMILNFGHTFAHGFESAKNFSKKINHGEAVLLGMIMASQLSFRKKILPLEDLLLIKKHYHELNLPMNIKKYFQKKDINKIVSFMKKDKKNFSSKLNLILLKRIGKTIKPGSSIISDNEIKKLLYLNF